MLFMNFMCLSFLIFLFLGTSGQILAQKNKADNLKPKEQVLPENVRMFDQLAASYAGLLPDRFVHARGTGAYGEFVSAGNWSEYTQASIFAQAGKKTPVFVRFSTVVGGSSSPEVVRDLRGMAVKFYTPEGNYDLLGHHLLVFLVRDPVKFNDLIRAVKPSERTGRPDATQTFAYMAQAPETTHMLTRLYSHLGTPASYRHLDACSVNAFKWRNAKGQTVYVKYTWRSKQGLKSLSPQEMSDALLRDPHLASTDLYETIEKGQYPQWDLYVQILKPEQLNDFPYNPLDATKIWPEKDAPFQLLGTLSLNRNPDKAIESDYAAFSPANFIQGIEASEDRLLQARLFSYPVASRKRLGDDFMTRYEVNQTKNKAQHEANYSVEILCQKGLTEVIWNKTLDFEQAGDFYRSLEKEERQALVRNLGQDLKAVRESQVQIKMLSHFYLADTEYGTELCKFVGQSLEAVKQQAEIYQANK